MFSKHKIIHAKSQKSITNTNINTIDYHYCIERNYRKENKRVSSHLKTNSGLFKYAI